MENRENKVDIQDVLSGLKNTASTLSIFLNQTRENLPPEQKDLLDKEINKAQSDLAKVVGDLNKFKI